jgi:hypothetical protein
VNVKDLIPLLPLLIDLVESMIRAGHDPKTEIERIRSGYSVRAKVEAEVQETIRRKFPEQ